MTSSDRLAEAARVARALGPLFSDMSLPVLVVRLDGRFVCVNDAALRTYGYSLAEMLDMRLHDLAPEHPTIDGDLALAEQATAYITLPRRPHRRKDGERIWIVPNTGPIEVDGERLVVGVLTEVTPMLEAEARAHAANEAALRDRQSVLGATLEVLREREVRPALRALARAFALAVGRRASLWLPEAEGGALRMIASHGLGDDEETELAALRIDWSREPFSARARTTRTTQVIVAAEAAGSAESRLGERCIVAPLLGRGDAHGLLCAHGAGDGDLERSIALATTLGGFGGLILEAVQLERRAEAVWHAASERLTDGIALLDRDLRIVRVNNTETARLGIGVGVVGKRCAEVFPICARQAPCPHRVALTERLHLVRELDEAGAATRFGAQDDGRARPFRVDIIPASPNDAEIAVIHVVHDLADERAMRTRLLTADRLATIGRLSAGVAHEINNPAAFVTVNLGVLRDRFLAGEGQPSEILSILDDSLNGMHRIREIVRDLKGFARERSRDVVDLSQVALSAIRIAAHETRGRARVERVLGDGVLARGRGARLAQCVLNLLVNAAQALPPGGSPDQRIEVRTYGEGERVRLEVTDSGPGVPDALKRRIFEPFFTTREASGGTGLGLWLARGIVEEENGTLEVLDAPGGGARFVIDLPAHRSA